MISANTIDIKGF